MTVSIASSPSAPESPATVAKRSSLTRKSIKKYLYPTSTKKDNTNPILLHSVNDDLFPRLWSFLAEVMVVEGELPSSTKEAIAWKVNSAKRTLTRRRPTKSSSCKKGLTEQQRLQAAVHEQALGYAEALLQEDESAILPSAFALLNEASRAEIALIVLLFRHIKRSMTAILGQQHHLQSLSFCSKNRQARRSLVHRMMAPIFPNIHSVKPGMITSPLFAPANCSLLVADSLPEHLKLAVNAGEESSKALCRLLHWIDSYENQLLTSGVLSPDMLTLLDQAVPPLEVRPHEIAQWLSVDPIRTRIISLPSKEHQDIARVLLLVKYSPESVANSIWWVALGKALGKDNAATLLLWYSLRVTLQQAKGLDPRAASY